MANIKINPNKILGEFKILNAVNNGPACKRHAVDQARSNFQSYKEANIPYARNHDASHAAIYGGEHTVDISAVFPDFNANPYMPDSYDFACTDEIILIALDAGTKTFYRLGQKIEHYIKKYNIFPPADFHKWAVICEHIIRHYTKGWANGFFHDMPYWEIWNEPDLDLEDNPYKRTWTGTKVQFFDLFEITAKHLKKCFPELKIGGPALAGRSEWAKEFLEEMNKRSVPMDFFSWHVYCNEPSKMLDDAKLYRKLMDDNGYEKAESILNEWNYVQGWTDEFTYSIEMIHGVKGASFVTACMCAAQHSSIDMLMYYDARIGAFNGLWDFYTLKPLKGYYPFKWYGELYTLQEIEAECSDEQIYTLSGVDENGKTKTLVTYYSNDDSAPDKKITVDFGRNGKYEVFVVDGGRTNELIPASELKINIKVHTILMICEK